RGGAGRPEEDGREHVVLVHGLLRTPRSWLTVRRHLEREGFSTGVFAYPSLRGRFEAHGRELAAGLRRLDADRRLARVPPAAPRRAHASAPWRPAPRPPAPARPPPPAAPSPPPPPAPRPRAPAPPRCAATPPRPGPPSPPPREPPRPPSLPRRWRRA